MLKQLKKRDDGFTIIEVLIVLAIAGLILAVVLIAVPNLQRNQRNSARKNDASRILTAADNYVSNNNGTPIPTALAGATAAEPIIYKDAGALSQYTGFTAGGNTAAKNQLSIVDGSTAAVAALTVAGNAAQISVGAQCDSATPGATKAGTSGQQVLQYTVETSSGWQGLCIGG